MGRKNRFAPPGLAYHVVNRRNDRQTVFHEAADYTAFLDLLAAGVRRFRVLVFAYCLMPNHFHLIAQPQDEQALSAFMQWVTCRYACRYRQQTETVGQGHVFQRRFWNAPLYDDHAFLVVLRYVEANPLRAGLVDRAEAWGWSSMRERDQPGDILSPLPLALPAQWTEIVNAPLPEGTLAQIRRATVPTAGRPLAGDRRILAPCNFN